MSRHVPAEPRWETLAPSSGVLAPLQEHAAAYDPDGDTIAIVGGRSSSATDGPSSRWHALDVLEMRAWSYRGADRLYGHTAAYDPSFPRILVFGGRNNAGRASGELLQIDLRKGLEDYAFSTVKPAGDRPPGRLHHAAAFDPTRGWLVVYGGASDHDQPLSEGRTWVYESRLDRWTALEGAWIGERVGAVMVYDPLHETVLLAGGSRAGPREAAGALYFLACEDSVGATPTATPSPAALPTDTTTPVPTAPPPATSTATDTVRPSETPPPTLAPSPTSSASATPSGAPSPEPTPTPSARPSAPACHLPLAQRAARR